MARRRAPAPLGARLCDRLCFGTVALPRSDDLLDGLVVGATVLSQHDRKVPSTSGQHSPVVLPASRHLGCAPPCSDKWLCLTAHAKNITLAGDHDRVCHVNELDLSPELQKFQECVQVLKIACRAPEVPGMRTGGELNSKLFHE